MGSERPANEDRKGIFPKLLQAGADAWRKRAALYAAVLATTATLDTLFTGAALTTFLGAAFLAVAVTSCGKWRFLLYPPTAALYTLLVTYGRIPFSRLGWEDLASRISPSLYQAIATLHYQVPPYNPTPGLLLIGVPAAMTLLAIATSLTLYWNAPVGSVAILGLSIATIGRLDPKADIGLYFGFFLFSAVVLLFFSEARKLSTNLRRWGMLAAILTAGGVLLLPALAPAVTSSPGMPLRQWASRTWGIPGPAPVLDGRTGVGDYLNTYRNKKLYEVISPQPLYWRGETLNHFDGVRWTNTIKPGESDGKEVSSEVRTHTVAQSVKILNADTNLVFGGYEISRTSLYSVVRQPDGSWVSGERLVKGSQYFVMSRVPRPSAEQLQHAGTDYPESVRQEYLQLPRNIPKVVPRTARKIQRAYQPRTPYEKALAIERYLRRDGGFSYDLSVHYGQANHALTEFLGNGRRGFCVQFASSMALLSREMGVPSRVVYGATTGKKVGPDRYVVRGRDLHMWVEIYFPGVGWQPFDPTPGSHMPAAQASRASHLQNTMHLRPQALAGTRRSSAGNSHSGNKGTARQSLGFVHPPLPVWALSLIFAGLVGTVPLAKRLLVARGTPRSVYRDMVGRLESATRRRRRKTKPHSSCLTPAERLVGAAQAAGLDPEPFEKLGYAYSEHLYAADPHADMREPYVDTMRQWKKLPRRRRLLAALDPFPVWQALWEMAS